MVRVSSSKKTSPSIDLWRSRFKVFICLPSSPGELFALSHFLQQQFSMSGIESAAFATFGHDPCSLLWGEASELHIFDHLPDEIERNHAVAALSVKLQNFSFRQPILCSPKAEGMFGTVSL